MSNCLQLDHVDYAYGAAKILVLSDVSADFESGKMYAITGPSGAGKSTALKMLEDHRTGKADNYRKLWSILVFITWHRLYIAEAEETRRRILAGELSYSQRNAYFDRLRAKEEEK